MDIDVRLRMFTWFADVSGAVLYLSLPASDFVTGHTLFVDGGWHLAK